MVGHHGCRRSAIPDRWATTRRCRLQFVSGSSSSIRPVYLATESGLETSTACPPSYRRLAKVPYPWTNPGGRPRYSGTIRPGKSRRRSIPDPGKNLYIGRAKKIFHRELVIVMRQRGASIRAIVMHLRLGKVRAASRDRDLELQKVIQPIALQW
jgi:hypothetical protein